MQGNLLSEAGDIIDWLKILDQNWKKNGFCAGGINIDSDSYVVFIGKVADMNALSMYAKEKEMKIDYACRL